MVGLCLAGCDQTNKPPAKIPSAPKSRAILPVPARVAKLFGGKESWRAIDQPITVEAFRIDGTPHFVGPNEPKKPDDPRPKLYRYPIIAGPVAVPTKEATALADILRRDDYEWDSITRCLIEPGIAVRFKGKATTVEVLFCFKCDQILVFQAGQEVGNEEFDHLRGELAAVFKRVFPDDRVIQNLE